MNALPDITTYPTQEMHTTEHLGVVYKKLAGACHVRTQGGTLLCSLAPRLYQDKPNAGRKTGATRPANPGDPLAVGDLVRCIQTAENSGQVVEVLPRRSQIARRSAVPMPTAHAHEQVIAANIDQVVPVFAAADPAPKWNMLDRYLVSAEAANLPALICITKLDLAQAEDGEPQPELQEAVDEYRRAGYAVILTSAAQGTGIAELQQALAGRISVLMGKSGVGKTSLLNALQPGLGLRVQQVSQATGKGKHTTSHLEMFDLQGCASDGAPCGAPNGAPNGAIIDTPGVREFGLWEIHDDLALLFPEMRPYLGQCRFRLDCQHDEEPGCAVRKAVMDGQISPRRWQSYLHLKEENP